MKKEEEFWSSLASSLMYAGSLSMGIAGRLV